MGNEVLDAEESVLGSNEPAMTTDSPPGPASSIRAHNDSHLTRDPSESSRDPTPPSSRDVEEWAENRRQSTQQRPFSGDARQTRGKVGRGDSGGAGV